MSIKSDGYDTIEGLQELIRSQEEALYTHYKERDRIESQYDDKESPFYEAEIYLVASLIKDEERMLESYKILLRRLKLGKLFTAPPPKQKPTQPKSA